MNIKSMFTRLGMGLAVTLLCLSPVTVHAADSATYSTADAAKNAIVTDTSDTDKASLTNKWVKVSDTHYTLDTDGDGNPDIDLTSETNADGEQEWTYTFYTAQKASDTVNGYNVYEQMTEAAEGSPWKDGYTSEGDNGTGQEGHQDALAIEADPGKIKTDDTYVVSNTLDGYKKQEYGKLSLAKTVADPASGKAEQNSNQTFTFTVTLKGSLITGTQVFGTTAFTDGKATVTLSRGETITFANIPVGTSYTIKETVPDNYTVSATNGSSTTTSGTITGSISTTASAVTFTNTPTYTPPETKYTSFTVTKTVNDNGNKSDNESFSFTADIDGVETYASVTATITSKDGKTSTITESDEDGNGSVRVSFALKSGEKAEFTNIPENATYVVVENTPVSADGLTKYTPSIVIAGTDKEYDEKTGTAGETTPSDFVTAEDGKSPVITFTNTVTRTQKVYLEKIVLDKDGNVISAENDLDKNGDEISYAVHVVFGLKKESSSSESSGFAGDFETGTLTEGFKIVSTNGTLVADDRGIAETTMYVVAGQTVEFTGIPLGTTYQFTEEANGKTASYVRTATANDGTTAIKIGDGYKTNGANDKANEELGTDLIPVIAGQNDKVTFTNQKPGLAKIKIVKYEGSSDKPTKTKLGGAEFVITKDGDESFLLSDGTSTIVIGNDTGEDADPAYGESKVYEVEEGTYRLVETVAPDRHYIAGEPYEFTIDASQLGNEEVIEIAVYDDAIIVLPITGGTGRTTLFAIAGTITALGVALIIISKKRRTA